MSNYGMHDLDSCNGDEREMALPTIDVFEIEPELPINEPVRESFMMTDVGRLLNDMKDYLTADGVSINTNAYTGTIFVSASYVFFSRDAESESALFNNGFNETFADAVFELKEKCASHIARKEAEKNGN